LQRVYIPARLLLVKIGSKVIQLSLLNRAAQSGH